MTVETCSNSAPVSKYTEALHEPIITALEELYGKTTDRKRRFLTFCLSLLAFIATGWLLTLVSKTFTLLELGILVLLLFIHEAGHYLTMRAFGYRNLTMFFIPLLGAAVSGCGSVSVVKESLIYLAGPVPGILIGYACGIVYWTNRDPSWLYAAQAFVTVNALNLLPIYPLDGGRFFFGLLPRRTYPFQWLLQLALAALIIYLSFIGHLSSLAGFLLALVLGQTPHLYRKNRAAQRLSVKGLNEVESDTGMIPPEVLHSVIASVRETTDEMAPKTLARITWDAWTQARARRPSRKEALILWVEYGLIGLSLAAAWILYPALM